jgi:hypothetical protein
MSEEAIAAGSSSRLLRLLAAGVGLSFLIVAGLSLWFWLPLLVPRWFVRGLIIGTLWAALGLFLVTLAVTPVSAALSVMAIRRARRERRPWLGWARVLALSVSSLLGALSLEAGIAGYTAWIHRMPIRPVVAVAEEPTPKPGLTVPPESNGRDDAIDLVVVGESSARGEPFQGWLSVGHIVAWQLEHVFPGRRIRLEMRAEPGINIEQAIARLSGLEHRPDAILVFAGHNEFQSRFGWSRNAEYYPDDVERPKKPPREQFLEGVSRYSSVGRFVHESLDRQKIDIPPPKVVTRKLVDVPSCSRLEYANILQDFRRRLEGLVEYCESIGALPLLISPSGNDADFPPNRSVMSPAATKSQRDAFARDFLAARKLEESDPNAAVAAYRGLVDRQPTFAEAHYRLARLLSAAGAAEEARPHLVKARDLDGLLLRCPTDFQEAYHDVARTHDVVHVDAQRVLTAMSPRGVLGDYQIQDPQHPSLRGHVALACDMLRQLQARRAFGWPEGVSAPAPTTAEVADHFEIDREKWAVVCDRAEHFYSTIAYVRYDPSENVEQARRLKEASRKITEGSPIESVGIPGLGY